MTNATIWYIKRPSSWPLHSNGAPDSDGTEASFIQFWDDNIRRIPGATYTPIKVIRDNNRDHKYSAESETRLRHPEAWRLHFQRRRETTSLLYEASERRAI
jgi:hypothetical protein